MACSKTTGVQLLIDNMDCNDTSQTTMAKRLTAAATEIAGKPKRITVFQLNHVLRLRRNPTLLMACAAERVTGISPVAWMIPA